GPRLPPLESLHFADIPDSAEMVGAVQVIFTRYEDTFVAIAREYGLGNSALRRANPTVDHWLPGEGTPVYLPTSSILPQAPREGIRSEERRVGKEWRARWTPDHEKKGAR